MKIEFKMVFETDDGNVHKALDALFQQIKPTLQDLNIRNWMPTVTRLDEEETT